MLTKLPTTAADCSDSTWTWKKKRMPSGICRPGLALSSERPFEKLDSTRNTFETQDEANLGLAKVQRRYPGLPMVTFWSKGTSFTFRFLRM